MTYFCIYILYLRPNVYLQFLGNFNRLVSSRFLQGDGEVTIPSCFFSELSWGRQDFREGGGSCSWNLVSFEKYQTSSHRICSSTGTRGRARSPGQWSWSMSGKSLSPLFSWLETHSSDRGRWWSPPQSNPGSPWRKEEAGWGPGVHGGFCVGDKSRRERVVHLMWTNH